MFSELTVSEERLREDLPLKEYDMEEINIWTIMKDGLGKDLSRFALPGKEAYHDLLLTLV